MTKNNIGRLALLGMASFFLIFGCATADVGIREDKVATDDLKEYAGSYQVAPGTELEVSVEDDGLYLRVPGQEKISLQAEAADTFTISGAGAKVVFERDDGNTVTGLVLYQSGHQTPAKKRDKLQAMNIVLKDGPEGTTWKTE